jgi:hypothetical protein
MQPIKTALVVAGAALGARAVRRRVAGGAGQASGHDGDRWLVVTVNRPPEEVTPDGRPPEPLARLGDDIEVQVRPAPGGRGTELAARPRTPAPSGAGGVVARVAGTDPRQEVRAALRDAKALIETGEVLQPDAPPTTRPTPAGKLLDLATRRAHGEGRL